MVVNEAAVLMTGDRFSRDAFETGSLERRAVSLCQAALRRSNDGGGSAAPLPHDAASHLAVRLAVAGPAAGTASLWAGKRPLWVAAFCGGADPAADRECLRQVQLTTQGWLRVVSGGAAEPGFDFLSLSERPLAATVVLVGPDELVRPHPDRALAGKLSRLFAAAFFTEDE